MEDFDAPSSSHRDNRPDPRREFKPGVHPRAKVVSQFAGNSERYTGDDSPIEAAEDADD